MRERRSMQAEKLETLAAGACSAVARDPTALAEMPSDAIVQSSFERREPATQPRPGERRGPQRLQRNAGATGTVLHEQSTLHHPEQEWRRQDAPWQSGKRCSEGTWP